MRLAVAPTGDLKHDIALYVDEIKWLASSCKDVKVDGIPERMSLREALDYFKRQYAASAGMLKTVRFLQSDLSGRVDDYILEDYRDKCANLLIRIHKDLKKQGLVDWEKINRGARSIPLQGGFTQLIGSGRG